MKILLSPAKSINEEATLKGIFSIPNFEDDAQKLINQLKKLTAKKIAELMSISPDLAQLNEDRFKNWSKANSIEHVKYLQAIRAFTGEVYRGFEVNSVEEFELDFIQNKVRILSGLYGILKPFDLISPYRLEMGTKFSPNTKSKNLYDFWSDRLTKYLANELESNEPIINLASAEYSKVINFKRISNPVITPIFKEFKNGKYSIVMMYAKYQRGKMARYLVDNRLEVIKELKLYNMDGYSFDDNLSSENEWVFVR
jgi:cytoplasmic iron level regulating protein YaaA (DUF328/UPF0246 family)